MQKRLSAPLQSHREPVRVAGADQEHRLKEEDRGRPHGGRSTHEGKHHLGDHRVDQEEQKGARKEADGEYGKHGDRERRLPLVKSRRRADQVGISWQARNRPGTRLWGDNEVTRCVARPTTSRRHPILGE